MQSDSASTATGMKRTQFVWHGFRRTGSTAEEASIDDLKEWLRELRLERISGNHNSLRKPQPVSQSKGLCQ